MIRVFFRLDYFNYELDKQADAYGPGSMALPLDHEYMFQPFG